MSVDEYQEIEREQTATKRLVDHRERWDVLEPLLTVNGTVRERVEAFAQSKRISFDSLIELGSRIHIDSRGGVELAWGYEHRGAITGVKYRPLGDKKRYAAAPSTYLYPLVIGDRLALDWFVGEGETDSCRLYDLVGDVAAVLCLPAGAGAFKIEWAAHIPRGATVYLCHDADEKGDQGAEKAAKILGRGTVTVRVRPPVDGTDWCGWPGDRAEFVALVRAAKTAKTTEAPDPLALDWQRLSEIAMRSIIFLDRPLLQAAAFHLLCGRKGAGKGTLLAEIASRVTRGDLGPNRNVVWIGSEDSAAIDIKPRIVAAGGDPARILVLRRGWVQLPRDIDEIGRVVAEMGEVGLLTLDPIGNHIAGKNSDSETDIRTAISPLNGIADEHNTMVFGVRHLSEKECSRGVLAAILGSSAWVQTPRAVLAVVRDNEDDQVSHIQCVAGNRLPAGTPGRMFRIEGTLIPGLENEVTRAVWIGESTKDVETMLSTGKTQEPTKSGVAKERILDLLEAEGDHESDALDARIAQETGLAARTIRNLRGELKNEGLIRSVPVKDEHGQPDYWKVARTGAPRPSGDES